MKKYVFMTVVWLSLAGGSVLANNPEIWNRGELVLANGTEIEGELNYNWKAEIVQCRQGNTIKAYSAYQVSEFRYFDNGQGAIRKFFVVNYPVKPTFNRLLFLEEFVAGTFTVYRRLRHIREPIKVLNSAQFGTDEELTKDVDNFNYFVYEGEKIVNLNDFVRVLWPRMQKEFHHELRQYMAHMQIEMGSTLARLLLINQYNYLKEQTPQHAASHHVTFSLGY